ncbi:DUF2971 domain-containing protein [Phenylobacterium sp.]|uniref:DUF2971 domain-containing protein n=1 Tax=Phenylobacterium sp. TaxID=1871053 RepID=UPI002731DB63|nr:DUF2971 domain-containing protein [Phenylobacterium sp.]MDP2212965.1 DUF2971 domain-containing protein [Phenylobacterium sp.]
MGDLTCRLMIVLPSDLEGHLERPTLATWTMEVNKGYGEQEMPPELWAAQCAVEELRQELQTRRDQRRSAHPIPDILYHYTDLGGLQGMFSSFMMWLSDAAYMNDPLEGTWVHRIALSLCLEVLGDSAIGEQTRDQIDARLTAPDLWDQRLRTNSEPHRLRFAAMEEAFSPGFIASFTEDGDLLSQWRGYGAGGEGVSIGFDLKELTLSKIPGIFPGDDRPPVLIRVEYDPDRQAAEIRGIFERVKQVYDAHANILAINLHTAARLPQLFYDVIRDALHDLRWEFKSPYYREEREWRLVSTQHGIRHGLTRMSNGHIVPYVEMPLPQVAAKPINRLAIPRIVLGPRCPPSALRSIRGMLQNLAYPEVVKSNLALR